MASSKNRPWIVCSHDPIQKLEDNLWTVTGQMPRSASWKRRMTIVRCLDGSLLFFNAVPVSDEALAEIRAWGIPRWLLVPNQYHKLDAHPFRERLALKLICAAAIAPRVGRSVPVDGHVEDFPEDAAVQPLPLQGTKQGEVALRVKHPAGNWSVVFSDAFMNVPAGSGLLNALLRFSGGPKCPPIFRFAFTQDKQALARDLACIAALPNLARLIPSHGDIVDSDAANILRAVISRDLGCAIEAVPDGNRGVSFSA